MKKILLLLFAIGMMTTTFAQDTILLKNSGNADGLTLQAYYSFREVGSRILSSRTAFVDDANELIQFYFGDQCIVNDFWRNAAKRYAQWPEQQNKQYNPKSMIYVPNHNYVKAIIFDWSTKELKMALFCTDGLWTTEEHLSKKWNLFINKDFIEIIDFNEVNEEW